MGKCVFVFGLSNHRHAAATVAWGKMMTRQFLGTITDHSAAYCLVKRAIWNGALRNAALRQVIAIRLLRIVS